MPQTTLTPKVAAVAHELVLYEAATLSGPEAAAFGAIYAIQKLGHAVRTLAGTAGFRSLLTRALILAQDTFPYLSALRVKPDGSLKPCDSISHREHADGAELVLAQLLGLLVTFIGESLTLSLVTTAWPDLPYFDGKSPGKGNHDTATKSKN